MRACDVARLSKPYDHDPNLPGPGPAPSLEMDVPSWARLETTILGDLSTRAPYGVAWWAPHPGTSRRILISDQLYACTESVPRNLIEAALHWLEFLDSAERESDRLVNAVKIEKGQPIITPPRPQSPLEDLGRQMVRLHVAGVVRALSGALDCMAGTIIGVVALAKNILRADFGGVRAAFAKIGATASTDGERVQASFGRELERLIDSAGPAGWLDWTLQFRNMLVHRGRRIELGQLVPRMPMLYGPHGQPIPRVKVVDHLPRDPGRSDVEVFLEPANSPILTEDAEHTLSGLLTSTRSLVEAAAKELLEVWNWRRGHTGDLPQPAGQWPNGPSTQSIGFSGYAPGSFKYSPSMMMTHPDVVRRMGAAALDDTARSQWKTFD